MTSLKDRILAASGLPIQIQAQLSKPLVQLRAEAYATTHEPSLDMLRDARRVAFSPHPVLITGETGTGKELVAKIMLANRPNTDFYPINCAGIVDTLFESLVFGHLRGTFTGATTDRQGILAAAGSGVVFFDEIGELPMTQQAKLLRALQERVITPVGGVTQVSIKCRFVFATNRHLPNMVRAGQFREDLFYRISTFCLTTYPLRDRPDDAPVIMDQICREENWDPIDELIPDAVIRSPGNVRALRNWMIRYRTLGTTSYSELL